MFARMLVATREFKVTVPSLLFDPGIFAFDFAANAEFTKFLVVDEQILDRAPFIDIRFEPLAKAQFWVDTGELFDLESRRDVARPAPAFIFHHAFVCSTLLARCLSRIDAFFSLKEPWILRRLADHKRANPALASSPKWRELFCSYVQLLCRSYATGRTPVIKATNVANNLLADVLHFMPACAALYLHSDLETFLVSNLKRPGETQRKIPALTQSFLGDCDFLLQHPEFRDTSRMSFLRSCALLWLVGLYNLRETVVRYPGGKLRTLDMNDFLDDPRRSLASVSRHFGHVPDAAEAQAMIDAEVMRTHAKDPAAAYGIEQRRSELDQVRRRHERELEDVKNFILPLAEQHGIPQFLREHALAYVP